MTGGIVLLSAEVKVRSLKVKETLFRLDRNVAGPWKAIPPLHLTSFASDSFRSSGRLGISLWRKRLL